MAGRFGLKVRKSSEILLPLYLFIFAGPGMGTFYHLLKGSTQGFCYLKTGRGAMVHRPRVGLMLC